jgi:hypothetical protein
MLQVMLVAINIPLKFSVPLSHEHIMDRTCSVQATFSPMNFDALSIEGRAIYSLDFIIMPKFLNMSAA